VRSLFIGIGCAAFVFVPSSHTAQRYLDSRAERPVLHGRHWVAITGKPLGATAGAKIFDRGGNAVDSACAMLGAVCTMYDDVAWGGETLALIYNPIEKKVIGINALGVAPTGATPEFYREKKLRYPPGEGPLAALTPGTVGGLLTMLAEYGTLPLKEVLAPAMEMAEGYPVEEETSYKIQKDREKLKQWPYSRKVLLPHLGEGFEAPRPGEILQQPELRATLQKLVEAEAQALKAGKNRKQAIYAAYDRFYRGDIAEEFVRGSREQGGLHTMQDLAKWEVKIEEPLKTSYKGFEVHKLSSSTQGPTLLQMLNLIEPLDLQAMGYNSARYIHTLYQVANLAFADRDFYYGDPFVAPDEPLRGLLSKQYARERWELFNPLRNEPDIRPGDPYPFQGGTNPFTSLLENWKNSDFVLPDSQPASGGQDRRVVPRTDSASIEADSAFMESFFAGTTSIEAADEEGWVVSVTPSGGWVPAVIAGRTGIGLSQRAQSFVTAAKDGPYNVIEPGKRPRVTLTPTLALQDGEPYLAFAVQGGDSQDQNLLQFFLNVVEFGMTVQQAVEAPNVNSYQMRSSFGAHESRPGRMTVASSLPESTRQALRQMGYTLDFVERTSGPINAILFDRTHRTMWGGSSNHGEDYGIAW